MAMISPRATKKPLSEMTPEKAPRPRKGTEIAGMVIRRMEERKDGGDSPLTPDQRGPLSGERKIPPIVPPRKQMIGILLLTPLYSEKDVILNVIVLDGDNLVQPSLRLCGTAGQGKIEEQKRSGANIYFFGSQRWPQAQAHRQL